MIYFLRYFFLYIAFLSCIKHSAVCYASPFEFDNEDALATGRSLSTITEGRAFEQTDDPGLYDLIGEAPHQYFVSTISTSTNASEFNQPRKARPPQAVPTVLINTTEAISPFPVKVISSRQIVKDPEGHFSQYKIGNNINPNCTHPHCKYNPESTPLPVANPSLSRGKRTTTKKRSYVMHDFKDNNICSNLTAMPFYPEYYVLKRFEEISYLFIEGLFKIIDPQDPGRLSRILDANPLKIFPYMDEELLKAFDKLYPEVQDKETFYYDIKNNRLFLFHVNRDIKDIRHFVHMSFEKYLLNHLQPHLFCPHASYEEYNFLADYLACLNYFNHVYFSHDKDLSENDHQPHFKMREALNTILGSLPLHDTGGDMIDVETYEATLFILFFKTIIQAHEEDFNSHHSLLKLMQTIAFSIKEDDLNLDKFSLFLQGYSPYRITPYFRSVGGLMSDLLKVNN